MGLRCEVVMWINAGFDTRRKAETKPVGCGLFQAARYAVGVTRCWQLTIITSMVIRITTTEIMWSSYVVSAIYAKNDRRTVSVVGQS